MKFRRAVALLLVMLTAVSMLLTSCGRIAPNAKGRTGEPKETKKTVVSTEAATGPAPETGSEGKNGSKETEKETEKPDETVPDEDGEYTSKDDVALYIHVYGKLPKNFITKKEAERLGWSGGSLERVAPGKSLGGSYFGNYEGLLPEKKGRTYTECDIDTAGKSSRGAKRIVFSNDGLIYYTDDHYETFTLLYGEEILKKEGN